MIKRPNDQLGRPSIEEFKQMNRLPVVVILDNVRSMHNIGSFFRTCDAFGIESIYLCGITATPPNKEIHKTALGAEQSMEWHYYKTTTEAAEKLIDDGYTLIAIEQVDGAVMLNDYTPSADKKYALIFGNEVFGVDQSVVDMCHEAIEIPQIGTKHSLNVSVSGGVVLWHLFDRLFLKK